MQVAVLQILTTAVEVRMRGNATAIKLAQQSL